MMSMTNADLFRTFSDVQLARVVFLIALTLSTSNCSPDICYEILLEWLQEEIK